ncbi:ABC transporter permease/substrate binding protein [Holzapfeliella sp. He02]|uniref:ABC transporter permease/substrate binding protein n=1 Tax=Holzapfeliella saturejae TaxID=3082953 RepID=A0ABU8SEZ1_9LACO
MSVPQLPVADWVEAITQWLTTTLSGLFGFIQTVGQGLMNGITNYLTWINPFVMIAIVVIGAFFISGRKFGLAAFSLIGLLFVENQGAWSDLMSTFTLILVSSLLAVIIGIPLGIWSSKSNGAQAVITPILDFMQTMPGFVYLIPAVAFFGIGVVPGVFASVIFALPPTVRMTNLGIRQVPGELVEASESFGSTASQRLFKLDLPLAKNTIMAGVNQTVMLSLSMVVISSMIGAPGLGRGILSSVQRAQVGSGFVNGLSIVILAIIIDRYTQGLNRIMSENIADEAARQTKKRNRLIGTIVALVVLVGGFITQTVVASQSGTTSKGNITLAYFEMDDAVATTNVAAQILRDAGYNVDATPLDNSVMWQAVANKQADALLAGWLPLTHKAQYEKFKDQLDLLGANYEGAQLGLVVPSYMNVNSIDDLKDQANKTIVTNEPGSGATAATKSVIDQYANLKDNGWKIESSSTGAMAVSLGQAIKNHKEIIISGWTPHWIFGEYDVKFLQDPKKGFGESETINTFARQGLKDDKPEAYNILKQFKWSDQDINEVMLAIRAGKSPQDASKDWISKNQDKVNTWINSSK